MEWCRLYASLEDNPRVQAAMAAEWGSFGLLMQSYMYCTRAESDGFIPHTQVPRFGGPDLDSRVKALVSEDIWLPEERGYRLDPEIWNEERNLSDQADKKRQADKERIAAKRKAAREAAGNTPEMSRDSRATCRATVGDAKRDSRVHRREEESIKTPPTPPAVTRPLWPAAVTAEEGEGDQSQDDQRTALAAEIREIRPEWSTTSILRALTVADVAERPWPAVAAAAVAVARDPVSQQPGRLAHDGPWWHLTARTAPVAARPAWCGACDETTRLASPPDGRPGRCPDCHPLTRERAS